MTIQEFIDLIDAGDWHLDENNCLSDDNEDCPLWHVYRRIDPDEDGDAEDYIDAGKRLGLTVKSASMIAAAADNRGYPRIRRRLLEAAGVSEC